jgi:hypothetical protein
MAKSAAGRSRCGPLRTCWIAPKVQCLTCRTRDRSPGNRSRQVMPTRSIRVIGTRQMDAAHDAAGPARCAARRPGATAITREVHVHTADSVAALDQSAGGSAPERSAATIGQRIDVDAEPRLIAQGRCPRTASRSPRPGTPRRRSRAKLEHVLFHAAHDHAVGEQDDRTHGGRTSSRV